VSTTTLLLLTVNLPNNLNTVAKILYSNTVS
jgi:hypothetical protein